MHPKPGSIGERIRHAREAAGLTLEQLANICGVPQMTLWRYERGDFKPGAEKLASIAQALGVTQERLCPPPTVRAAESQRRSPKGQVPGAA